MASFAAYYILKYTVTRLYFYNVEWASFFLSLSFQINQRNYVNQVEWLPFNFSISHIICFFFYQQTQFFSHDPFIKLYKYHTHTTLHYNQGANAFFQLPFIIIIYLDHLPQFSIYLSYTTWLINLHSRRRCKQSTKKKPIPCTLLQYLRYNFYPSSTFSHNDVKSI